MKLHSYVVGMIAKLQDLSKDNKEYNAELQVVQNK